MITITIHEWLVWAIAVAWATSLVFNIVLARVYREHNEVLHGLIDRLFELSGIVATEKKFQHMHTQHPEYRQMDMEEDMNRFSEEGWELMCSAFRPPTETFNDGKFHFIWKKPVSDEVES